MPSLDEVWIYLTGLWQLAKGDRQGFDLLDISERGLNRSFWAIIWCMPSFLMSWSWERLAATDYLPQGTSPGLAFFLKLALIDALNWIVPLILVAVLCLVLDLKGRFTAIVVISNWLSVPFSYGSALLITIAFIAPGSSGLIALLWLTLLIALVFSLSRILRMVLGQQPLVVATTAMTLIIPPLLLTDALRAFLGLAS